MIAAVGHNNVIGHNGDMPWGHLPEDLKYFQKTTKGKILIMGRITYEGICRAMRKPLGETLPGRKIILLSRSDNLEYVHKNNYVSRAGYSEDALCKAHWMKADEVMISGGESVYNIFLPKATKLYITYIDGCFNGDRYFPKFSTDEWEMSSQYSMKADEKNAYNLTFKVFDRKSKKVAHHPV